MTAARARPYHMMQLPLITGSRGRLGRALCEVLETEYAGAYPGAVFSTHDELDVSDYFRLRAEFERVEPTVVVNCAAYAQVDGCETQRDLAAAVNTEGARLVSRAARAVNARVIQVSTDLVFDGKQSGPPRPYREDDAPQPLSHYAATKLAGEMAVMEENPDHAILRSSWFFGVWPPDRFPEVFLTALDQGRPLRMVSDRLGSPTYLRDLARAIAVLIDTPYRGVLHYANRGEPTSRYHLVAALAERLGIATRSLVPLPNELWTEDVAVRPVYSALDPTRYEELTGRPSRTWRESLEEYVTERAE